MIRETAVGIDKLTAGGVGTETLQYVDEEAAIAVTGIDDDVHSGQWMVVVGGIDLTAYIIGEMGFIACHEIVVD